MFAGLSAYRYLFDLAVVLVVLIGGFVAGYRVESWHCDAMQKAAVEAAVAQYKAEAQQANAAAAALEAKLENQNANQKVIVQTVDHIVEKPVYRNRCFDDDGLRAANAALTGQSANSGGSHGTVPGRQPAR